MEIGLLINLYIEVKISHQSLHWFNTMNMEILKRFKKNLVSVLSMSFRMHGLNSWLRSSFGTGITSLIAVIAKFTRL